jgi:hypothetical protein
LLLLELSLKLSKLPQLGLWLPHRWWHGCARGVTSRGIRQGAFALIFIRGSFMVLLIAHEALSRWVLTLIIRVETLKKVVAAIKELTLSPWVIKPGEISIGPGAIVLLRVDTRGRHRSHEEL